MSNNQRPIGTKVQVDRTVAAIRRWQDRLSKESRR